MLNKSQLVLSQIKLFLFDDQAILCLPCLKLCLVVALVMTMLARSKLLLAGGDVLRGIKFVQNTHSLLNELIFLRKRSLVLFLTLGIILGTVLDFISALGGVSHVKVLCLVLGGVTTSCLLILLCLVVFSFLDGCKNLVDLPLAEIDSNYGLVVLASGMVLVNQILQFIIHIIDVAFFFVAILDATVVTLQLFRYQKCFLLRKFSELGTICLGELHLTECLLRSFNRGISVWTIDRREIQPALRHFLLLS